MASASRTKSTHPDLHLIQRIMRQDQNALLELYHAYGSLVYGLALRILRNPGLAEEITQDVFLKIWQQPQRWNPALGQFSSWLLTITRNAAIDRLRKERHTQVQAVEQIESLPVARGEHDALWFNGQVLVTLMAQLPAEQRRLIELAFYQGYTHSELAEKFQLPLGTVKTRLRMGLQKLRNLWEHHGG